MTGPVFPAASHHYGTILSAGGRNYYVLRAGQALLPTYSGKAVAADSTPGVPKAKGTRSWLVARDAHNGLPLWRRAYDGTSTTIVADAKRIYTMIGSTKEKPKPLWSFDLPAEYAAEALAIAGEHVLVGTASADRKEGQLLILSMKDGSKLAEHPLPGAVAAEGIAVVDGAVYVSTWTGEVLCLTPAK